MLKFAGKTNNFSIIPFSLFGSLLISDYLSEFASRQSIHAGTLNNIIRANGRKWVSKYNPDIRGLCAALKPHNKFSIGTFLETTPTATCPPVTASVHQCDLRDRSDVNYVTLTARMMAPCP